MIRISGVLISYFVLIFLILFTLGSCSKDISVIQTDNQLLEFTNDWCKKENKDKIGKVIYSCASGESKDFELSKTKSILMSKVKLAEKIITTIDSKESFDIAEDNEGITKDFKKVSSTLVNFDLSGYEVVKQKTLKHHDKWITFTLLKLVV